MKMSHNWYFVWALGMFGIGMVRWISSVPDEVTPQSYRALGISLYLSIAFLGFGVAKALEKIAELEEKKKDNKS